MQEILDAENFHRNFDKSLGALFRDFYSPVELNILEKEIQNHYCKFNSDEEVDSVIYIPGEDDPLLRRQHTILIIACDSLPFFASRIRKAIQLLDLNVGRSLHFHPQQGKELYYIEVLGVRSELLEKVRDGIHASYKKIKDLTLDFKEFNNWRKASNISWSQNIEDLQEWLLAKSYVWEGCSILESNQVTKNFGNVDIEESATLWLQSLNVTGNDEKIECFESNAKSFLGDERYFYICFLQKNTKIIFIGCLNQFAKASALVDIPYYRDRFHEFLKREMIEPFSGLGRTTRMMFNYIPTELIFLLPEKSFINIHSATLEHSLRNALRSVGVVVSSEMGLLISFVPEANWSEITWESSDHVLRELFPDSIITRYFVMRGNFVEAFHLIRSVGLTSQKMFDASSRVEYSFRTWQDHLELKWLESFKTDFPKGDIEFHDDYKATHTSELCIQDLKMVEALGEDELNIEITKRPDTTILHAVTPRMKFFLSQWVKILNDMGLSPISQRVYHFKYKSKVYAKSEFFFHHIENKKNLYNRIQKVFYYTMIGKIRSDSLSEIILWSELDENGLVFSKAIRDYCLQSNVVFNPEEFNRYLVDHPNLANVLWEYFKTTFRDGKQASTEQIKMEADAGKTIREDDTLHAFASSVLSIIRTDFFGTRNDPRTGIERDYFSFKIDSAIPESLPDPRPYRETFVYSNYFQGIHLRGGAVARGGIRWSDRISDYRTELLSLMKTQMIKNSIIVPVGSKGSFVLTPNPILKKELDMVSAYKFYISGLLGLVDNRSKGEIVPFDNGSGNPPFALDEADPYLVVAADKGTAQLSDTANSISEESNYWLGDAFASGGSRGYSHKQYGITARGALVTADRNLRLLGVDFRNEPITLVGIGDMGGDVFGNGLLESKYFKLIAAFNHKHIFLDPTPDSFKSYEERKRLFHSNNSGWDHYDAKLISQGGGVWNRTEKSITISPQAREALGISDTHLSGSELIQCILKAKVDLLYNGGIGTYVKASSEENSKVGDPSNNDVRVDAKELKARAVSEGGNLGFTQAARIEYDQLGGSIFTDAIDNSAGVDLSDHEVNLKIFMNELMEMNKIKDSEERDKLLLQIDQEVVHSVLLNNELQSLAINVDRYESEMDANQPVQPRPVLSNHLAEEKMKLYELCLKAEVFLPGDFPDLYLNYFPKSLVSKYREELFSHPLQNEISTTRAVNFIVNFMGAKTSFLYPEITEDIPIFLRKLLLFMSERRLDSTLDKLALYRDKSKEKEVLQTVSKLRNSICLKFSDKKKSDPSWIDSWSNVLSEEERQGMVKIFE
jgi:glutamate dehydrogenase